MDIPTNYPIDERDVVPDGSTAAVVPDWPAQEGAEVTYWDNTTFRRYKMVSGVWRVIGSAGGIWEQVDHVEVDSAANFTISDLAGDDDGLYRLTIRAIFSTAENVIHLRFNNDNGANYYIQGSVAAQNEIQLSNGTAKHFLIEILIHPKSGVERLVIINQVYYEDNATHASQIREGIWTNTADEITSMIITAGQNFLTGSEYWIDKRL